MDWYDRLEHDPGCDLAYIREFVPSDTICSCYQGVLNSWPKPTSWVYEIFSQFFENQDRDSKVPTYSTGGIKLDKKVLGGSFGRV